MDGRNLENLDYSAGGSEEPDGAPLKPTRAGPMTIALLLAFCAMLIALFMMFILRVF